MNTKRRTSLTALIGILALAGAACGSDNDDNDGAATSQGSGSSQSAAEASDTVTAIPALTGVGTSVILDAGTAGSLKGLGATSPSRSPTSWSTPARRS